MPVGLLAAVPLTLPPALPIVKMLVSGVGLLALTRLEVTILCGYQQRPAMDRSLDGFPALAPPTTTCPASD
jgi:hypothetical protein